MNWSFRNRTRVALQCMVVVFSISLQCSVLSSFLSALHEIEHAAELADTHTSSHKDHQHVGEHDHYHSGIHHLDSEAGSGIWLVLDGHSHGLDPTHASGTHGFFHFSESPALLDEGKDFFRFGEPLPADPPLVFNLPGLPCAPPGILLRPPIA